MTLFLCLLFLMTLVAGSFIMVPLFFVKEVVSRTAKIVGIFVALVVCCLAGILYAKWGASWSALDLYWQEQQREEQFREQLGSPDEVIAKMKAYLKTHPDRAEAWYLLGRLYLSQGRNAEALDAFKKAKEKPQ